MASGSLGNCVHSSVRICLDITKLTFSFTTEKIGPWGPELVWYVATKYKISMHQGSTMTNGGRVCRLNLKGLDFLRFPV